MTKRYQSVKRKSKRHAKKGVRGEILVKDGSTFTSIVALPRIVTPTPKQYSIYQTFSIKSWHTTSAALNTFNAVFIQLAQFGQVSSFIDIFDQYMIDEAEIWISPQVSSAVSSNLGGRFTSVIDLDDATNLTTMDQADQYSSAVQSEISQGHYRHFIPHVALSAYGNGVFTSFANRSHQWIDAASTTVQHYGVKIAVDVNGGTEVYDLRVRCKINFRSVH